MKLLVDIGNSCLKWAIWENKSLSTQQRIPYQHDNVENILTQAWEPLQTIPQGIWVANVAGTQIANNLVQWVQQHWQCQPVFITTTRYQGEVKNGYSHFEQLGVDRWLALIGAHSVVEKNMVCVVDCGTAVTVDVLSCHGYHLGGVIMPGINATYNALLKETTALTQLPNTFSCQENTRLLAQDTHTGVALGTLYAILGLVEYVINSLENEGNKLVLILTGGDAPTLMSLLRRPYRYIPDLVLQGMVVVIDQTL